MPIPKDVKLSRSEAKGCLIPGRIFRLRVMFPQECESHDKYLIFGGIESVLLDRPLFFKINTDWKELPGGTFSRHQFKIRPEQYPVLDHESYVDCHNVWYLLSTDEILDQLIRNPKDRIDGDISDDHKRQIVQLIRKSESIEPPQCRAIANAFGVR